MTLEEFTEELDAKFASMTEEDLKTSLMKAGFEFEDDFAIEVLWNGVVFFDESLCAANSNEMALAA